MYYEEPYKRKPRNERRQPRRRRRKTLGGWLAELCLRLVALALFVILLCGGLLYALPASLFAVEPEGVDLSLADGLPSEPANILLLGLDAIHENSRRSDAILIASVGYGQLKLTSVLRDMVLDIPGRGPGKLNAAYAYGGPTLVMKTLNENLGLNLVHYAAVDFRTLVNAVDALGGVELSITEAEMNKINQDLQADRQRVEAYGYAVPTLTQCGDDTHLNGLQALTYARIRKLDSDFGRTARQRRLLAAILKKLRAGLWNPALLSRLYKAVADTMTTDMSAVQLLSLGEKALAAGSPEQFHLPVEGAYADDGSSLTLTNPEMNTYALKKFIYGDRD